MSSDEAPTRAVKYLRPRPLSTLSKQERVALLRAYYEEYRDWAQQDETVLNRKVPRKALAVFLDTVGELILREAKALAGAPGSLRQFLDDNRLPQSLAGRLSDDFRIFCLLLNGLKQWISAEQLATDRYLLGGNGRQECKAAAQSCILSGEPLDPRHTELHHPVRDGRPPIPLTKDAHAEIEGQRKMVGGEGVDDTIRRLRRELGRSWIHLRRGCNDLLGRPVQHSTRQMKADSRAFARKMARAASMTFERLLEWLDQKGLGT